VRYLRDGLDRIADLLRGLPSGNRLHNPFSRPESTASRRL
jgi:hypothetical protein